MERSEHHRQELVSQYRTLLETSTDGFFINVGGRFRYANPAFQRLMGATSDAELAATELSHDHPARYHIGEILAAASRARGLTGQILAFSRGQPPSLRPLELRQAVIEELSLLRAALPVGVSLRETLSDECFP